MSQNDDKLVLPLDKWGFDVKIYDIEVVDNLLSYQCDYEDEDLTKNNITEKEMEEETGKIIIKSLEEQMERWKGKDSE